MDVLVGVAPAEPARATRPSWGAALPAPGRRRARATAPASTRRSRRPSTDVELPPGGLRAAAARRLPRGRRRRGATPAGRPLMTRVRCGAPRPLREVNLGLEVLGVREDGYHELRTLFQTIDLARRHRAARRRARGRRACACDHPLVPHGRRRTSRRGRPSACGATAGSDRASRSRSEAHPGRRRARRRARATPPRCCSASTGSGSSASGPDGLHRLAAPPRGRRALLPGRRHRPRPRARGRGVSPPASGPGTRRGRGSRASTSPRPRSSPVSTQV